MTDQHLHKNTIRHQKNNQWLQRSEKPENHKKMKISKFQENHHKPSQLQRLEQYYKVTPCNEKCNFFILLSFNLLKSISLLRIFLIGIIRFRRVRISILVQFLNLLFCRRGMPLIPEFRSPILTTLHTCKIFHIHTIANQWIKEKVKDTKFMIIANSCHLKKSPINPVWY